MFAWQYGAKSPKSVKKITDDEDERAAGVLGFPSEHGMVFKLVESARNRWRAMNAPHLVTLVRACATFINGQLVERVGRLRDSAYAGPPRRVALREAFDD